MDPGREHFLATGSTLEHLVQLVSDRDFEPDKGYRVAIAKGLGRFKNEPHFVFAIVKLLNDPSPLVQRVAKDVLHDRV